MLPDVYNPPAPPPSLRARFLLALTAVSSPEPQRKLPEATARGVRNAECGMRNAEKSHRQAKAESRKQKCAQSLE